MTGETRVLLVVAGGIAAYKALELIRRLREQSIRVRCILTRSGAEFVTPLSLSALTEDKVYGELFSLTDEAEMGHIQLSRDADLMVVAPATADLIAKMATGQADDLASTALLATDKEVLIAPAMNVRMWDHPATRANIATLQERGVKLVGPYEGDMACGEFGFGRMAEPHEIVAAILTTLGRQSRAAGGAGPLGAPLAGRSALVTSGPTHEAIDPVRYIANRSSGKQGHAIARALSGLGARTTLVTGPTQLPDPTGMEVIHIESAQQMLAACETALPADIAVCAAAVADWRVASQSDRKIKKTGSDGAGAGIPKLELTPNPDILASLSQRGNDRPGLVVGFAAETEDVIRQATEKRARKACDWIVANDVSPQSGTFGGAENTVHVIDAQGVDSWARMDKSDVAQRLAERIADYFAGGLETAAPTAI
ncbi:bifunctional phosphopantothenoylcysteine decarboxylase/phosphopantothenate--cysteine ligase CoaBC [Denitrobaculum tricleocarpae]|uniref:Coenzyme A biosynthesis bifunctional protein CoaBC n=1 Tax=Denitrobaculum tricleocarpae TaxID=2591009 RepID=A0A545TGN4_9PROT|nr:bifunctional phosphopantothenoylcysteine decarboxylase/phosphopantothenate--cysteine ligase CoaBC [Denitrobaculum tricleocarpae]TQV76358.1 bifunctional phosphopantothenoylcysteine decarboxylase/phosphopantothenate--cysteine ligase CoaBC [Denitrobaculum tricleocarpae]